MPYVWIQSGRSVRFPVAAGVSIERHDCLSRDPDGHVRPLTPGTLFSGFSTGVADASLLGAGELQVPAYGEGVVELPISGVTDAQIGDVVYAIDHQSFTLDGAAVGTPIGTVWDLLPGRNPQVKFQIDQRFNMRFRGNHRLGEPYYLGDVVNDGSWTMSCERGPTFERPAPQPQGTPDWYSGLSDTPTWDSQQNSATYLLTGQRYTFTEPRVMSAFRYWIPETTNTYEVWFVEDPEGQFPQAVQVRAPFTPTQTGWFTNPLQGVLRSGVAYELRLIARASVSGTEFTAPWDQKNQNGNPSAKEMNHQNNQIEMRFHHTDNTESDQQANLEAVTLGANINTGSTNWTVQNIDMQGSHVRYTVTPALRLGEQTRSFTFSSLTQEPVDYVRVVDHFAADPEVQGVFSVDGTSTRALDNNAYGVDLQLANVILPNDWGFLSVS